MNIDINNDLVDWKDIPEFREMAKTMTLGRSMRSWRKCDALNLTAAATKLGISKQLLSEYERGIKLPSLRRTLEMAEILGGPSALWLHYRLQDELRPLGFEPTINTCLFKPIIAS